MGGPLLVTDLLLHFQDPNAERMFYVLASDTYAYAPNYRSTSSIPPMSQMLWSCQSFWYVGIHSNAQCNNQ